MPSQTITFSVDGKLHQFSITAVELRQFGLLVPLQYRADSPAQGHAAVLTARIMVPLRDEAVFFVTPSWAVHVIEVTATSSSRESIFCTIPVSLAPESRVGSEIKDVSPTPLSDMLVSRWFKLWQNQQLSLVDHHHQQRRNPSSLKVATFKSNLRRVVDHHLHTPASATPTYELGLNQWAATTWEDFQVC